MPSATRSLKRPTTFNPVRRVLIVYGSAPSGHAAAAAALEQALRMRGLLVSRVEVASEHHSVAGRWVAAAYHALLKASPRAWSGLYDGVMVRRALRALRSAYLKGGGLSRLIRGVERHAPDVIVCPQAAIAAVFAEARRLGALRVPVVSVLTDFGVHPFWSDPPTDLLLVPTRQAAQALEAWRVPADRLRVTGLPIHPVFATAPSRDKARSLLGLPRSAPVILLSGGSQGLGGLEKTSEELLRLIPRAHLLVLCGRNGRLLRFLSRHPESASRLRPFGPQPPAFVATLLSAADLQVGKPGGLSAAESLALGVPMVLLGRGHAQERANADYLRGLGAAVQGDDSHLAAAWARRLLGSPSMLGRLSRAAQAGGRPQAAALAAEEIDGFAGRFDSVLSQE